MSDAAPERMPRAEMMRRLENLHVNAADRVARLTRGFHDRDVVAGASADADALAEAMRLLGEDAACREDSARMDRLEALVRESGGLVLHVDARMVGPTRDWPRFPGLGLEPGALRRTLRQAIDDTTLYRAALAGPAAP